MKGIKNTIGITDWMLRQKKHKTFDYDYRILHKKILLLREIRNKKLAERKFKNIKKDGLPSLLYKMQDRYLKHQNFCSKLLNNSNHLEYLPYEPLKY